MTRLWRGGKGNDVMSEHYSSTNAVEIRAYPIFHDTVIREEQGAPFNMDIHYGMTRDELGKMVMAFNARFSYQLFIQQDMDQSRRHYVKFYTVKKNSCFSSDKGDYNLKMSSNDETAMNNFILGFIQACQAVRKKVRRR